MADYNFFSLTDNLHNFKEGFDVMIEQSSRGAVVLAGFLSFYVLVKIGMKLLAGERFPWTEILSPLLLFVVVSSWSGVVNLMDDIGFYVEDNLTVVVNDNEVSGSPALKDAAEGGKALGDMSQPPQEDKPGNFLGLKKAVNVVLNTLGSSFQTGWMVFLEMLTLLARMVLQVMGYVYLILLGVLGSWAFAFGIIPELNTIKTWIASYLQYFLWGPLCCLVGRMVQLKTTLNFSNMSGDIVNPFYSMLFNAGFNIAIIFVLFSIPKISRIIISAGEDIAGSALGQFAAKVAGDTVSAASKIMKGGV